MNKARGTMNIAEKKIKKMRRRLKNVGLAYGLAAAGVVLPQMTSNDKTSGFTDIQDHQTTETVDPTVDRVSHYREIDFQVDTLNVDSRVNAYFTPEQNAITAHFFENDAGRRNQFAQSDEILVHEEKHRYNGAQGLLSYSMSMEEYYKVCAHNEISANLAALLSARQKYIETGEIDGLLADPLFSFYLDAVLRREVNPRSLNQDDFDQEMTFMMNGMRDAWMKHCAAGYDEDFVNMGYRFAEQVGVDNLHPDADNYRKSLEICYQIGGIDFNQYLREDIVCYNPSMKDADRAVADGEKDVQKVTGILSYAEYYQSSFYNGRFPEFDGKISFSQYQDLLYNCIAMQKVEEFCQKKGWNYSEIKESDQQQELNNEFFEIINNIKYSDQCVYLREAVTNKVHEAMAESILIPPAASDSDFEKKLEKVYCRNGINIMSLLEDKCFLSDIAENPEISQFTASSYLKRIKNYVGSKFSRKRQSAKASKPRRNLLKQPIKPYTGKPLYAKWSPEKRVSEVQRRHILDMAQPVINRPSDNRMLSEKQRQNYTMDNGTVVTLISMSDTEHNAVYDLVCRDKNGSVSKLQNLSWVDTDNIQHGLLAVSHEGEAICLRGDGKLVNISRQTGIFDVEACYWNNGIMMLDSHVNGADDDYLHAVVKDGEFYQSMPLGKNVYDADENGLIALYNEDEKPVRQFSAADLEYEIKSYNQSRLTRQASQVDKGM